MYDAFENYCDCCEYCDCYNYCDYYKEREQEVQEQRKRGRAGASTARSSIARQMHAFVTTSWQDLDIAPGHSHARYARALGRLELGVSSKVFKTFQRLPMPSKALPRASKKLPRASEASRERKREKEKERDLSLIHI